MHEKPLKDLMHRNVRQIVDGLIVPVRQALLFGINGLFLRVCEGKISGRG